MADPLLFHPITLRGLEIRNRVWVAPMCQYSAVATSGPGEGVPGDWHVQHLGGLGRGGAGVVMVESTGVVPEGRISPNCLGLYDDEQEAAFARIVPQVQAHGARIGIQLNHAGRKASTYPSLPGQPDATVPEREGGWPTVAPSAVPAEGLDAPRELTLAEIAELTEAFVASARRAIRAGFELIEVHAAHGYLLHQFLSPLVNRRTDAYGGTPENRARLLREIVRGLRAESPELPLVVRLSGDEWVEGGFGPDDAAQLAGWLADDGADLIDCSAGGNFEVGPPREGPSYQVYVAERVRTAGLPVSTVGNISAAAQAEGILATGQADVITLGRPLLTNPHLPISWAHELRAPSAASLVPPQYFRARF